MMQAPSTPQNSFVFQVYRTSVLETKSFDLWLLENSEKFNDRFRACFDSLHDRWLNTGSKQKQICDQQPNPASRRKCHDENRAQQLFVWASSLRGVLDKGTRWTETFSGRSMAEAWSRCGMVAGGCELIRAGLERELPKLQLEMTCQ